MTPSLVPPDGPERAERADRAGHGKEPIARILRLDRPLQANRGKLSGCSLSLLSGAVAWIVAHFATQAELHFLECRVTHNFLTELMPIHLEEFGTRSMTRIRR